MNDKKYEKNDLYLPKDDPDHRITELAVEYSGLIKFIGLTALAGGLYYGDNAIAVLGIGAYMAGKSGSDVKQKRIEFHESEKSDLEKKLD